MRFLITALLTMLLVPGLIVGQNGEFDLRATVHEINCDAANVYIDLEVKAADANSNFFIAHQNYRFTYNENAITNPVIDQELTLSGFVQTTAPSTFSLYAGHSLTGSTGNLVSYNIYLAGGSGYPLNENEWVSVGRIKFDALDLDECLDIVFNTMDPEDFPNTVVVGKEAGALYLAGDGTYSDNNTCLATACPEDNPDEETRFDLQFGHYEVDCVNRKFFVNLEIKSANNTFNAAFMNLRLSFNSGALDNPQIEDQYNFSGFVSDDGEFSFYSPHTLTGSINSLISYNVSLAGGNGTPVSADGWIPIGRLSFDIINVGQCADLRWHDSFDFPSSIIVEKSDSGYDQVEENSYNILDACFSQSCQGLKKTIEPIYDITMSPVPAIDYINMEFGSIEANEAQIITFDANGRMVNSESISVQKGKNNHILDVLTLPGGVFTVLIKFDDYSHAQQIIKIAP